MGFECHIAGKTQISARYREDYPKDKMDSYENLILLCGSHHKLLDDKGTEHIYTEQNIRRMKVGHEHFVNKKLEGNIINHSIRENLQGLYDRFKDYVSPNLGFELINYLRIIRNEFIQCLSMNYKNPSSIYHESAIYWNEEWNFTLIQVMSGFMILIDDIIKKQRYDYKSPEENKHVLKNWLKYFRDKCKVRNVIIFDFDE